MTCRIWWILTQPLKSPKMLLWWAIFVQRMRFELKKYRGVIFHSTEQLCKIQTKPGLVVSKMAWGFGWTFIRALKSLKNCTMMGSFSPKHMFQLENFRGILCHETEGWCKNWHVAWKITWNLVNFMRAVKSLNICFLMVSFVQSI